MKRNRRSRLSIIIGVILPIFMLSVLFTFTGCGKEALNETSQNTLTTGVGEGTTKENKDEVIQISDIDGREEFSEKGHPLPGDVIREYVWKGPYKNAAKWQRVTDPNATREDAKRFLPNPINTITIDDLKDAEKVEVVIEMWGGHLDTLGKKVKINGNDWIDIAEPRSLGAYPERYMKYTYPVVSIPLEQFIEGENTFEFTCKSTRWGQWAFTGVVFRVYYKPESKNIIAGSVVLPEVGKALGEIIPLSVNLADKASKVKKVEYIGFYEDFDRDGDGIFKEWHYNYRYGEVSSHIGTSFEAPFSIKWDTSWIPDQEKPIMVMARITDENGLIYVTPAADGIHLDRNAKSVKMFKPYDVPEDFAVRARNIKKSKVKVTGDLSGIIDARMSIATWAGDHDGVYSFNGSEIAHNLGSSHDISYDEVKVPVELIKEGANEFSVSSETKEHSVEVMWPGIALKVLYGHSGNKPVPSQGSSGTQNLSESTKPATVPTSPKESATEPTQTKVAPTPVTTVPHEPNAKAIKVFTSADASVQSNKPDTNMGSDNTVGLFTSDSQANLGTKIYKPTLLKFDVKDIEGKMVSAKIVLNYKGQGSGTVEGKTLVYIVPDVSWKENEITWNNMPERGEKIFEYNNPTSFPTIVEVDVSEFVDKEGVYSFLFESNNSVRTTFYTKEWEESIYHPFMEITIN